MTQSYKDQKRMKLFGRNVLFSVLSFCSTYFLLTAILIAIDIFLLGLGDFEKWRSPLGAFIVGLYFTWGFGLIMWVGTLMSLFACTRQILRMGRKQIRFAIILSHFCILGSMYIWPPFERVLGLGRWIGEIDDMVFANLVFGFAIQFFCILLVIFGEKSGRNLQDNQIKTP